MKKLLALFSMAALGASTPPLPPTPVGIIRSAVVAPPQATLLLSWEYPAAELTDDIVFSVWTTTNLTAPMAWTLKTNVVLTNSVAIQVVPGVHHFAVSSFSKFWNVNSPFSEVASTPPAPRSDGALTIKRIP